MIACLIVLSKHCGSVRSPIDKRSEKETLANRTLSIKINRNQYFRLINIFILSLIRISVGQVADVNEPFTVLPVERHVIKLPSAAVYGKQGELRVRYSTFR